jgi:tRNA 2-thiouridine synthesizing protein E
MKSFDNPHSAKVSGDRTMTYDSVTQDHWDVIEYLRDAFINHNGEQPNNRAILKAMQDKWSGRKVDNKTLFDLFPGNPSKQAGMIAGLPESMRKGGY